MTSKPETIDEYLAMVSPEPRATLEKLRRTIRTILPKAEECISYSPRLMDVFISINRYRSHSASVGGAGGASSARIRTLTRLVELFTHAPLPHYRSKYG